MKKLFLASAATLLAASPVQAEGGNSVTSAPDLSSVGMDKTEGCMTGTIWALYRRLGHDRLVAFPRWQELDPGQGSAMELYLCGQRNSGSGFLDAQWRRAGH